MGQGARQGAPAAGAPVAAWGTPSGFALFLRAAAALLVLWLPLAALLQIDALLFFLTWRDLADQLAWMAMLLALLAAVLALAGATGSRLLARLGGSSVAAARLGWSVALAPTLLLVLLQLALDAKLWLAPLAPWVPGGAAGFRTLWVLALAVPFLLALWRLGVRRLQAAVLDTLDALRWPAVALMLWAAASTALSPPHFLGERTQAPAPDRPRPQAGAPDVFLFTIDSLAATEAGLCNAAPGLMPHLQALARVSTCVPRFYASGNVTAPTTTTIETGALPWSHWVSTFSTRLPDGMRQQALGQQMQRAGYTTHFVSAALGASPRRRNTHAGYDSVVEASTTSLARQFDNLFGLLPDWSSAPSILLLPRNLLAWVDVRSHGERNPYPPENVYAEAQAVLARVDPARPVFLWMHTWPPHAPYLPPPPFKHRLLAGETLARWQDIDDDGGPFPPERQPVVDNYQLRYRESVMAADAALGAFLEQLRQQGRLDRALVVVSADHGESFGHGFMGHGGDGVHQALVHIPLLVKLPGQRTAQTLDMAAGQADLGPTLLAVAGGRPLPHAEGRSILPALQGQAMAPAPVFTMSMASESRFSPIRGGNYAVIDGDLKLVCQDMAARCVLHDVAADPGERQDLAAARPADFKRLRALMVARLQQAEAQRQRLIGGR